MSHRCPSGPFGAWTHGLWRGEHQPWCPENPENKKAPAICTAHSPAIVHRSGGPSADELNVCGICGEQITQIRGVWIAITDDQAAEIRAARR